MWDFKVRNGRCFLLKENFAAVDGAMNSVKAFVLTEV